MACGGADISDNTSSGPRSLRAADAAGALARRLGLCGVEPLILHESQHISIRLLPLDIVARAVSAGDRQATERLAREIEVACHLLENRAPVVGPAAGLPAGPHVQEGFSFTLWDFVEHLAADGDNAEHVGKAAEAMRRFHQALAGFRGELPDFWGKIARCRSLLDSEEALPALGTDDRDFLRKSFDQIQAWVARLPADVAPIHGDAHLGNVFITPHGALWNDLEDVCLGPREWDIGWLPEADLGAFEPVNRELFSAFHYLRSLCVSVWCWQRYDMPEKREAADYHLGYLRECGLFDR
jgi:hypothetical protein